MDTATTRKLSGVVDNDRVFADGTVTQAVDNTGRAISAGEDGSFTFAYDGQAHWVVPQAVTTAVTGQRVDVLQNVAGGNVRFVDADIERCRASSAP